MMIEGTNSAPNRAVIAPALERRMAPRPCPVRASNLRYSPAPVKARAAPGSESGIRIGLPAGTKTWKASQAA